MVNIMSDILSTQVARGADRIAIESKTGQLSWSDLDRRSDNVSSALHAYGVHAQARVSILARNRLEFYEILFGVGKRNGVLCPVNWRLSPSEMVRTINDARSTVLFIENEFLRLVTCAPEQLAHTKNIVVLGDNPPDPITTTKGEHVVSYERWISPTGAALQPIVDGDPDDVALQIYTSGTTGLPKGVMNTQTNLYTALGRGAQIWDFDEASVNLVVLPTFHNSGAVWSLIGMRAGAKTVVLRTPAVEDIMTAIEQFRVTNILLVPVLLQRMVEHPQAAATDFSSLRNITYGGSPAAPALLERCARILKCDLIQSYALSETTGQLAILRATEHDQAHLSSAGRPSIGTSVKVIDLLSEQEVATGEVGEIWVHSDTVMKGYWMRPNETAAALPGGGWFRTGDIGLMDSDGYLFLRDRINDMIITGGENVFPTEVERVLEEHPSVEEAAVIGVPDKTWGEAIKAIVVCKPEEVTEEALMLWCRERLASYKCPKVIEMSAGLLPRNPTGKLMRKTLRKQH